MQSALLDIIIIGCLVLLFASTYRKRATTMVRSWTLGWMLILVHFSALLLHPARPFEQRLLTAISLGALVACGMAFLLPTDREKDERLSFPFVTFIAGAAGVAFIALVVWEVNSTVPYYIMVAIGQGAWLVYVLRFRRTPAITPTLLMFTAVAFTGWLLWSIAHAREDVGISAILSQLYLLIAIVYMNEFRRISGGTLTVTFGLLAWSAVFPAAEFCDHLGIVASVSPELWNIPKYFVAFGMILVLLEEEMMGANAASKHYRMLFESNPHPMWIYDPRSMAFESVNDAAMAQYGYSREHFLSLSLEDIRKEAPCADEQEYESLEDSSSITSTSCRHKRSDGSEFVVDVASHEMESEGRRLVLSLVQDVTERQELHEQLLHQANHDLLTGLPNRAWMEQKMRETLAHSERYSRQSALLCLDVDRFKQINDTYGHGVGDICLQEVARRLARRLRGTDVAARVGGEEFSLLLHEIESASDAERVATDILVALQAPIHASGYTIELTASIGIAVYPGDANDAARLWRYADSAMYRAKRAGGNQYLCMSPEIGLQTSEASEMELNIRRALKEGGLELYYQPLYKTTGELRSLEALVRFQHPRFGLISPDRFVSIAEESGLIVPLGNWVFNEVCRQFAEWQQQGLPPVRTAINISPLQITRPDFASQVIHMLTMHDINPALLGMEITETAMMRNIVEASRQMEILAEMGIAFSIDDFGTGYSSLGQIDKLPVQTLKIDRTFIERICRPNGTYSIVDAIISMAHSLRLEVVAEGVEDQDQLNCLRRLKCDTVQGYLFSRPLPAADVAALLRSNLRIQAMSADAEREAWIA
jgi:diguanylate cyclase (GGDEF)-like protein/PAS domain S-box-containing protein